MIRQINSSNFYDEVLAQGDKVIVDFYADWCGPCKMVSPVLEQISEEFPEVRFLKMNIDENQQVAIKYDVSSIPTIIAFEGGEEVARSLGAKPKETLIDSLELS